MALTSFTAERDFVSAQVADDMLETIAADRKSRPFSSSDEVAGTVRSRRLYGFEVAYLLSRDEQGLAVTIVSFKSAT